MNVDALADIAQHFTLTCTNIEECKLTGSGFVGDGFCEGGLESLREDLLGGGWTVGGSSC